MKLAEIFERLKTVRTKPEPANGHALSTAQRSARNVIAVCHSLLSERGEVSGRRLASEALAGYESLDPESREVFFDLLLEEFSPDPEQVGRAGDAYRDDPSPENLAQLQRVVEPPRQELFRRLNMAPGGTHLLVRMRSRLLDELKDNPRREPAASDLSHLFASWFNPGFLVLQRIDWRTSATILEKLIEYEAVHEIHGWRDLRRRLEADRRCYAFFHPALPEEPIIFIEAALTRGMSEKVQPLLDPDAPVTSPDAADYAMFYSITNCQEGLRGVPLGSFLIKRVVEELRREFPRIRKFATVSPVPKFREWLEAFLAKIEQNPKQVDLARRVADIIAKIKQPGWFEDAGLCAELQPELMGLCAYHLLCAKHPRGNEPLDPVARFHLRNGARLERINWMGDTSAVGIQRSAGMMTNYVYRLDDLERNHEAYTREYKITAAYEIESMARQSVARPARR